MSDSATLSIEVIWPKSQVFTSKFRSVAHRACHLLRGHMRKRGLTGRFKLIPEKFVGDSKGRRVLCYKPKENAEIVALRIRPDGLESSWTYMLVPMTSCDLAATAEAIQGGATESGVCAKTCRPVRGKRTVAPQQKGYPDDRRSPQESRYMALAESMGVPHPVYVGHGLYVIATEVQPKQGEMWLEKFNYSNRPFKMFSIRRLGADMAKGKYFITHQGLAISICGDFVRILDGQNRLVAGLTEGLPFVTMITFGVDETAVRAMDLVEQRLLGDAALCSGINMEGSTGNVVAAALGAEISARRDSSVSVNERIDFFESYVEAFEWTHHEFDKYPKVQGVTTRAPVRAAVIRAFYHENIPALAEFVRTLATGKYNTPRGEWVIQLRDRLKTKKMSSNARKVSGMQYTLTTRSIYVCCDPDAAIPAILRPDMHERYQVLPDPPVILNSRDLAKINMQLVDV